MRLSIYNSLNSLLSTFSSGLSSCWFLSSPNIVEINPPGQLNFIQLLLFKLPYSLKSGSSRCWNLVWKRGKWPPHYYNFNRLSWSPPAVSLYYLHSSPGSLVFTARTFQAPHIPSVLVFPEAGLPCGPAVNLPPLQAPFPDYVAPAASAIT